MRFSPEREHVVVHAYNHGDENDRVVKEMKFDSWNDQLHDAGGRRRSKQVVPEYDLPDEQDVLEVVPELNHQGKCPPLT